MGISPLCLSSGYKNYAQEKLLTSPWDYPIGPPGSQALRLGLELYYQLPWASISQRIKRLLSHHHHILSLVALYYKTSSTCKIKPDMDPSHEVRRVTICQAIERSLELHPWFLRLPLLGTTSYYAVRMLKQPYKDHLREKSRGFLLIASTNWSLWRRCSLGSGPSTNTEYASTMILDFPTFRTVKNKFLFLVS